MIRINFNEQGVSISSNFNPANEVKAQSDTNLASAPPTQRLSQYRARPPSPRPRPPSPGPRPPSPRPRPPPSPGPRPPSPRPRPPSPRPRPPPHPIPPRYTPPPHYGSRLFERYRKSYTDYPYYKYPDYIPYPIYPPSPPVVVLPPVQPPPTIISPPSAEQCATVPIAYYNSCSVLGTGSNLDYGDYGSYGSYSNYGNYDPYRCQQCINNVASNLGSDYYTASNAAACICGVSNLNV